MLCCVQVCFSNSTKDLLKEGKQYFLCGQFSEARCCYENIEEKNSVVFQNIGNCHFNEGNFVQAIVYWRKAYPGASYSRIRQLVEAEKLALQSLGVQKEVNINLLELFLTVFPKILLQLILMFLLLLLVKLFYDCVFRYNSSTHRLKERIVYLLSLVIGIAVLLIILAKKEDVLKQELGVVVEPKSSIYVGPEKTFHIKQSLDNGRVVKIAGSSQDMYKIETNECSGWISSDQIQIV